MSSNELEYWDETKDRFMKGFEELRPDLFINKLYQSPEQREAVAEMVRPSVTRTQMYSAIPMRCKGNKCSFSDWCPLLQQDLAPINNPCPYEMAMVADFMASLMEELNVDPGNLNEVSLVRDLVDQEVQHVRKSRLLAQDGMIVDAVIGVDQQGTPIETKALHLAVELEDKILKRKRDIRNQLVASREAKVKAGQGQLNTNEVISNIFDELRKTEIEREKLLKQKLGSHGLDEYIDAHVVGDELEPGSD